MCNGGGVFMFKGVKEIGGRWEGDGGQAIEEVE
jgi:hypothetical protein